MRISTETAAARPRRRTGGAGRLVAALGVCSALLLSGCSEAQVVHPAASATPQGTAVPLLPPIGYNHRYGNNPVAAADAFALERSLFAVKSFWEVALRTDPYLLGYVPASDVAAVKDSRSHMTDMLLVLASESLPTLRALVVNGDAAQKTYCVQLVEGLRAEGYTGLTKVSVLVFFGESDRHAELTWTPTAGYGYTIFDNNLNGALTKPLPTATPFATPASH